MRVAVKIIYLGRYKDKTGISEETLALDDDISEAANHLVQFLKERYGIEPPYNLMINAAHIAGAVKRGIRLKEGDCFKLMPFLSGG